jgi:hypothetical protein
MKKIYCLITALLIFGSTAFSQSSQCRSGYPLPFLEQWNSGTFETNNWTIDASNWSVNSQLGHPSPTAQFAGEPVLANYECSLTSYPLLADSMTEGKIYLDYDIKLTSGPPLTFEYLDVDVWNSVSQLWYSAHGSWNLDGSFGWISEHIDITNNAMNAVFRIRFTARGENSANIIAWYIDNIHVYRECNPPLNLEASIIDQTGIALNWEDPEGIFIDQWIHWDDEMYSGNSIGTGTDWCAAARWTPEQLIYFENSTLVQVAFVPGEGASTYSIRVWEGEDGETLLVDQEVQSPILGQWNTITLSNPVQIDITKDLWVGYHILLDYGYPAGVDNGPAIDGFGNMLYFGKWETLLEVNPDLDYNWNIMAKIIKEYNTDTVAEYAIYRSDNDDPYFLRDYSDTTYYLDDSLNKALKCYYVTALYINGQDTCESPSSNEACEFVSVNENIPVSGLNIYPNPCNDLLKIESSEELVLITLYNSFGELMLKKKVDESQFEIPVSAYPAGVYMIRIEMGGRVISKKVMVVH